MPIQPIAGYVLTSGMSARRSAKQLGAKRQRRTTACRIPNIRLAESTPQLLKLDSHLDRRLLAQTVKNVEELSDWRFYALRRRLNFGNVIVPKGCSTV